MLDLRCKVASMNFLRLDSTHGMLKINLLAPSFLSGMGNNKELASSLQVSLYHTGKLEIGLLAP